MNLHLDGIPCYATVSLPETMDPNRDSHVFMGIGLYSNVHGLSKGLPIDILSMLITADALRKQLGHGKIFLLIADKLAVESSQHHPEVTVDCIHTVAKRYIHILRQLCANLRITDVIIQRESDVARLAEYQAIEVGIKTSQPYQTHVEATQLEATTKNYVLKQTALVAHYALNQGCALKVSWCKDEHSIHHPSLSNPSYDEAWFDAYYRTICGHNIGFVYTKPGVGISGEQIKADQPPYCAASTTVNRLLLGEGEDEIKKKLPLKGGKVTLPPNLRQHLHTWIAALKRYPQVSMRSKHNESNTDLLLADLLTIAALARPKATLARDDGRSWYGLGLFGHKEVMKTMQLILERSQLWTN